MRKIAIALLAPVAFCAAVPAHAGPYRPFVPVVVEGRAYSPLPRDPAATQDVDVGRVLIGSEAPARVDVYALTEDEVADIPVVSIERRVVYRPLRTFARRGHALVVKG